MAPPPATDDEKAKKAAEKQAARPSSRLSAPRRAIRPKKQLSKAERRELQEKQRAEKEAKKNPKPKADKPPPPPVERPKTILGHLTKATSSTVPPADGVPASIVELGQKYAAGEFDGSNDRCRSLLDAVRSSIKDYAPPKDAAAARDLDVKLKSWASYLEKCREPTASTLAALKRLRLVASTLPPDISPSEAQAAVETCCDRFREERVELAVREIGRRGAQKFGTGTWSWPTAMRTPSRPCSPKRSGETSRSSSSIQHQHSPVEDCYMPCTRNGCARRRATHGGGPGNRTGDASGIGCGRGLQQRLCLARSGAFAVAALAQRRHVPVLVTCSLQVPRPRALGCIECERALRVSFFG